MERSAGYSNAPAPIFLLPSQLAMYASLYMVLIICFGSIFTASHRSPTISPRHNPFPANLEIHIWTTPGCGEANGPNVFVTEGQTLSYSIMWPIGYPVQSYMLNRTLEMWERLDWSTPYAKGTMPPGKGIPGACGTFLQTTNPDSNQHVLGGGICYPISGGATVRVLLDRRGMIIKTDT